MSIEFLTCVKHVEMLMDLLNACLHALDNQEDAVCAVDAFMDKLCDKEDDDVPEFLWSVSVKLMCMVKSEYQWPPIAPKIRKCAMFCYDELRFLEELDTKLKETSCFAETKDDVINEVTKTTFKYVCLSVWSGLQ